MVSDARAAPRPRSAPLQAAQRQMGAASNYFGLDDGVRALLAHPHRPMTVSVTLRHDDDHVPAFVGHRVKHNPGRSPANRVVEAPGSGGLYKQC